LSCTEKKLLTEERQTLEEMCKNHPCHAPRMRAHAVLMSDAGFSLKELTVAFGICRQTASTWLYSWDELGICGLLDDQRSGRPNKLSAENQRQAIELIKEFPRSLKTVLAHLCELTGINLSRSTLKRRCKQEKLCWKQVRKSLKSKRDPELFAQSQQQLLALATQAAQQQIDVVYVDESGFTREPCVPYAWQAIGEHIEVPCSKSKRLNVLGFMSKDCDFQSMVFEGSITSAVVVAGIEQFIKSLKRQTALVIDNAPIHTSNAFNSNIEKWAQQGNHRPHCPLFPRA
jgi:transposase